MDHFNELKERMAEFLDLQAAGGLLVWDMRTYMPPGGAEGRAEQRATLEKIGHQLFTAPEVGELIARAEKETAALGPDSDEAAMVRVIRREYEHENKLPTDLVERLARATGLANQKWVTAKAESDFSLFAPSLSKIVALQVEKAQALGYIEHPYDALLDLYEPQMTTHRLRTLFQELRAGLVPLVQAIADSGERIDAAFLNQEYDLDKQEAFTRELLAAIGYDFQRGRQDRTAHPFTVGLSIDDVRVTNHFLLHKPNASIFTALHEGGHGLYEQGLQPSFARTFLGRVPSLGLHESQSRLWENVVGRSLPFWRRWFPRLAEFFPGPLAGVTPEGFYRAINQVVPSPIRIQADEVTYNLHILLRFEIEIALIEGSLHVEELPTAWNECMTKYLGYRPLNDAEGVLQDVHWSEGYFGYFPTYTLGNLLAVQFYCRALMEEPNLAGELAQGETGGLLTWLRQTLHVQGSRLLPTDLVQQVTGGDLQAQPFLKYLKEKYSPIYRI